MSPTIQQLASYWKQGAASPRHAIEFVIRRAVPFGISFKDLEAYRISTWRHGGCRECTSRGSSRASKRSM